jgi:protoporphyrinogen oxidase
MRKLRKQLADLKEENEILKKAAACFGLVLTGRSYRGVGIPDCIALGKDAAQRLFMQMNAL